MFNERICLALFHMFLKLKDWLCETVSHCLNQHHIIQSSFFLNFSGSFYAVKPTVNDGLGQFDLTFMCYLVQLWGSLFLHH